VELLLHQGSGELHTVTGAAFVDPHRPAREDPYRLSVGLVGAEAMLKLFVEQEQNERAFEALTRFLTVLDDLPAGLHGRAALDPLGLAFQLKLLWLSGYFPHLEACVECGAVEELVGYLPRSGGAVCAACSPAETVDLTPEGVRGVRALVTSPLADAHGLGLGERAVRDALAVVVASYEFHGGFRLRTLTA
jgi:DNA repair protein RecO (recombination protein O)